MCDILSLFSRLMPSFIVNHLRTYASVFGSVYAETIKFRLADARREIRNRTLYLVNFLTSSLGANARRGEYHSNCHIGAC